MHANRMTLFCEITIFLFKGIFETGRLFWKVSRRKFRLRKLSLRYLVVMVVDVVLQEGPMTMMLERSRVTVVADVFFSSGRPSAVKDDVIHCCCSRAFVQ